MYTCSTTIIISNLLEVKLDPLYALAITKYTVTPSKGDECCSQRGDNNTDDNNEPLRRTQQQNYGV